MGATDQPVSQSLIPGKLGQEQEEELNAIKAKLNKDSEVDAQSKSMRGSMQSPKLRESMKSGASL